MKFRTIKSKLDYFCTSDLVLDKLPENARHKLTHFIMGCLKSNRNNYKNSLLVYVKKTFGDLNEK